MTTFTQHARNRIEEYRDIDRRRRAYPSQSRHYPKGTGSFDPDDFPDIHHVGRVESPSYSDTIPCARVRAMMPMIEDMHFDPLFDGWGIPEFGLQHRITKKDTDRSRDERT